MRTTKSSTVTKNRRKNDVLEVRDYDSSSEQDFSETKKKKEGNDDVSDECFFIGKDKTSKWRKHVTNKVVRIRVYNVVIKLLVAKVLTYNVKEQLEVSNYFNNDKMSNLIMESTEIYIHGGKVFSRHRL